MIRRLTPTGQLVVAFVIVGIVVAAAWLLIFSGHW